MNVAMWAKALQVIPRLSKDEWNKLDVISKWLIATRSAVLIMTFNCAAIAGILAFKDGKFDFLRWLLLALGLCLAHATNNMVNDVTDYLRGVDKDNYYRAQYGPQPLEHGLMSKKEVLVYIVITGALALLCGVYLIAQTGTLALALTLAGAFFVLFYTWPLKYIGLGELAVLMVWGPLMTGGGYYVITGEWSWSVALASIAYALGPVTVIFGKHIDKLQADKEKGIRTLPVIIGEKAGRYANLVMIALMYLLVFYLIAVEFFSPAMLVVLLAVRLLPQVVPMYLQPKPAAAPDSYPKDVWPLWFVASAFYHTRRYGVLFLLGLLIDAALKVSGVWV